MRSESSSPLTCGCPYCGAWRKERGLERVPVEEMPEERALQLDEQDTPRGSFNGKSWPVEAARGDHGEASSGRLALAPDPHYASPGVGPMGAGQAADAAPTVVPRVRDARLGWVDGEGDAT